jgi:hypothetical protein
VYFKQCCGSGMLVPDPNLFHPGFRIPDPIFSHSGSRIRIKDFKYFRPKKWLSSMRYPSTCSKCPVGWATWNQCCGSESEIQCLFDPWIRGPGWVNNQDPDPGSGSWMNILDHISESLETIFWVNDTTLWWGSGIFLNCLSWILSAMTT